MSMNVNDFKEKFTKELFVKASECKNLREILAMFEKDGIELSEEELNILTSMMGEKKCRPEDCGSNVEWNADCYDRFKLHSDTCDSYCERKYITDNVWEGGHDPRVEPKVLKPICMDCEKARVKQYYCFCTK